MIRWFMVLAALPACDAIFRVDEVHGDGGGSVVDAANARGDARPPDANNCTLVGKYGGTAAEPLGMLQVCVPNDVEPSHTIPATLNTTEPCDDATTDVCVKWLGASAAISNLTVTGTRPLVIASAGTIAIIGTIDLKNSGVLGANCGTIDGQPSVTGGGGGAGGSFHLAGGVGGDAASGTGAASRPGVVAPTALQYGCRGGTGGTGPATQGGAGGGATGGSIYLIAPVAIELPATGAINASGFGGAGGQPVNGVGGGGGGGGAGGLIVFDTPNLAAMSATGLVIANGGGGGGGGGTTAAGQAGTRSAGSVQPGASGTGGNGAGAGGIGGSVAQPSGAGQPRTSGNTGGGGGGGAAGWILLYSESSYPQGLLPNTSPPPRTGT